MSETHTAFVDAWWRRTTRGVPEAPLLDVADQALAALWQQSHLTLGEVTLRAITNRVVRTARDRFPYLAPLAVDASGFSFRGLREGVGSARPDDFEAALRFLLVEFLTVIGNLTSQILTPELHEALSTVGRDARGEPASGDGGAESRGHESQNDRERGP